MIVTNMATDTNAGAVLTYNLVNPPPGATIDGIGTITWVTAPNSPADVIITTIATDTFTGLSATNSFEVVVLPFLIPGQPQTNILSPSAVMASQWWLRGPSDITVTTNAIYWYLVQVPYNAVAATNTLLFSTLPVNLCYSTNIPPSRFKKGDATLLANQTSGISVITTNTIPRLMPGSIYFLGVQNPNSITVTDAVQVDFLLGPTHPVLPVIPTQVVAGGSTLTVANTATDTNAGAALAYQLVNPPANAAIDVNGIITWAVPTNIAPTNVTITTIVTDTTYGLSATNSFNVNVLPGLTNGAPDTNVVAAGGISWFLVQVPANAIAATNTLLFATLPVNLWYSVNAPPTITNAADAELLINATSGISVITPGTTPPLVPGSQYYLGVQNTKLDCR